MKKFRDLAKQKTLQKAKELEKKQDLDQENSKKLQQNDWETSSYFLIKGFKNSANNSYSTYFNLPILAEYSVNLRDYPTLKFDTEEQALQYLNNEKILLSERLDDLKDQEAGFLPPKQERKLRIRINSKRDFCNRE